MATLVSVWWALRASDDDDGPVPAEWPEELEVDTGLDLHDCFAWVWLEPLGDPLSQRLFCVGTDNVRRVAASLRRLAATFALVALCSCVCSSDWIWRRA